MAADKINKAITGSMSHASRDSLAKSLKIQELHPTADIDAAKQLYGFANILYDNGLLLRALTDLTRENDQRTTMARSLLKGKASDAVLKILTEMVALRWSVPEDFLAAVEIVAANSAFSAAEREAVGKKESRGLEGLEKVEDNILEFRRLLMANSRLDQAFADYRADTEAKQELLDRLTSQADEVARLLLGQATVHLHGGRAAQRVDLLLALLNMRQQRWIAEVRTSVALDKAQEKRLQKSLSKMYEKQLKLDVSFDETLLGGLRIKVGHEVIDGSLASRISQIQQQLEDMV